MSRNRYGELCVDDGGCVCVLQVAEWWAEQHYDDFAAVVQPFFSGITAQNFSIEFISTVSIYNII